MDKKTKRVIDKVLDGFEVSELDEQDLEGVAGGRGLPGIELDIGCTDNSDCPTNSGNCVAGCGCQ